MRGALAAFAAFWWLFCGALAAQQAFDMLTDYDPNSDTLLAEYGRLANALLLWGPYRLSLYFGVRPRLPRLLLLGLMWYNMDDVSGLNNIRHVYEQGDNMKKANWVSYDPRTGGRQIIDDTDCHVTLTIDFVKSKDGLSWGAKVLVKPHPGYENARTGLVWYSGLEGEVEGEALGYFHLENPKEPRGYKGSVILRGISEDLGAFDMEITAGPATNRAPSTKRLRHLDMDPRRAHHCSLRVPDDNVWRARDIFMTLMQESISDLMQSDPNFEELPPEQVFVLRDMHNFEGNLHFVQRAFQGLALFEVLYNNAETPISERITAENIGDKAEAAVAAFDAKFRRHFPLQAPFTSKGHELFAKEMLSGLLGGLSYNYGDQLVDRHTVFDEESFELYQLVGQNEGPHELFTLVPSRPFFPRGFYWDEGFHLLPLLDYDLDLVLDVLLSWFNLIDSDGWIAREQILGPELRSRVPEQFQVQSPDIVNPPTMMLVLTYLLQNAEKDGFGDIEAAPVASDYGSIGAEDLGLAVLNNPQILSNYTRQIYAKLGLHFDMFRRTQQGYIDEFDRGPNPEGYRWRGRTVTHLLASGLDDYPRALPADVAELNVDLLSWMGVMSQSMGLVAGVLEESGDQERFDKIKRDIIDNVEMLHWSETDKAYCDVSVNEDDENVHVCHKGYISLFPFLTHLVPEDRVDRLQHIVDLLTNPEELWSEYGIRLLSASDVFYGTAENYWRSPIWININYLVLESLQHYRKVSAGHLSQALLEQIESTYTKLRENVVGNIYDQWKKTGFAWEQYDDRTGKGKGAKNFLGWTSSVILMMRMPEQI